MVINGTTYYTREQAIKVRKETVNGKPYFYGLNGVYLFREDGTIDIYGDNETLSATRFEDGVKVYWQGSI